MAMLDRADRRRKPRTVTRLISGEDAFVLHDTFGFPIELTREIAADARRRRRYASSSSNAMREQRERARADARSKRAVVSLAELPAVRRDFTGYGGLESEGEVVAILQPSTGSGQAQPVQTLSAGQHGAIILDRTSFYAERGGQIGDRGRLFLDDGSVFEVDDTQYMGEAIAHHGVVKSGEFTVGVQCAHVGLRLVAA